MPSVLRCYAHVGACRSQAGIERHATVQMRGVHITLRMRLECKIVRGEEQRDSGACEELYEVMNEVVVDRGANPYLAKIECWERDTLITKVSHLLCIRPAWVVHCPCFSPCCQPTLQAAQQANLPHQTCLSKAATRRDS